MKTVFLDFSNIQSVQDLHLYLKAKLDFPEFYGMNWDAFWDSITGLVEMPDKIEITGFEDLKKWMPVDIEKFSECLSDYNNTPDLKKIQVDIKS